MIVRLLPNMSDDEHAIRELVETWMTASRAGDLPAILNLMADDVVFMTPGREPFGKDQFQADFEALKGVKLDGEANLEEVQVAGDWAWIRNHIDLTITPSAGPALHRSGYTLTILRKEEDGNWRLFRDSNLVS
ncbi:MAG TPA: SgcJ/EcaC family oxidoreductase [Sphingomicrobium sp.]|jgi:uncharacterized protein (TIGR02246 family)|nr:SgcJ/EcaC family oxidoreductase [Sphingomicrobium sp.]